MNLIEAMRQLLDLFEEDDLLHQNQNKAVLTQVITAASENELEGQEAETTDVMIPPLQQKIELLKKIAGVESAYDECSPEADLENDQLNQEEADIELNAIKKNAGLALGLADDLLD